ncbi:hypothetical protein BGX27_000031 [Mortierella sp. AM989]|nr:hypothetical protein BGX27_000031 [Mortierella sp. AM989]
MSNSSERSVQFTDLPDKILLRIFDHVVSFELETEIQSIQIEATALQGMESRITPEASSISARAEVETGHTSRKKSKAKKSRVAGLGARTLCRLCCSSRRMNHLASADQLWQPITLARFPDRHWPTTDQKNLDLIKVRREHQLKLLVPTSTEDRGVSIGEEGEAIGPFKGANGRIEYRTSGSDCGVQLLGGDDSQQNGEDDQRKKQKRTKFYSRFEQRAHRRKFGSLDPELKYSPLAWTNTLWSWKRTYFGDCRFVESKDVKTPNRIVPYFLGDRGIQVFKY